ncbi:MAG: DUF3179 domain-containing protein [Deltaproteobacteria bacterium]|nr:DUF3179 domain-containing protein [Deltaproteobacteria bacterium]
MRPSTSAILIILLAAGVLLSGCAHRDSNPLGYWESIVMLTETFEADAKAAVSAKEAGLTDQLRETLDTDGDGMIVHRELWAHQEQRAARPYSGPQDLSEMSGQRDAGFPLNVDPEIISAADADLGDDDLVIGIVIEGQARAYPVNYMNGPLNEVVNDTLAGEPIASTW